MLLSIIIPAKDEEKNLPALLNSIRNQGFKNGEIEVIVADAFSNDRTREIAREIYHCKVIGGGLPAKGRNNGADYSLGDLLVFKDADSPFPLNFLKPALNEFHERGLDVAGTLQYPLSAKNGFATRRYQIYLEFFVNRALLKAQNTAHPLLADCIFTRKSAYQLLGGFDESLEFGEDSDYAKRAKKAGIKFGILESCGKIGVNMRRFDEAEVKTVLKNLYYNAGRAIGHEFKRGKSIIPYWK